MSSHAFRGAQGAGIAFNKVVMAIVNFPRLNIKTWINQGHAFTMNPSEFATTAASTVEAKYADLARHFRASNPMALDRSRLRVEEQWKSLSQADGTLHVLCRAYLNGLKLYAKPQGVCGLIAKSREHSAPTTMTNRTGRAKFWHEVQFVYDGKVICVWKLEATGVTHGAGHQENLRAAVSEFTHLFAAIARTGKADDDGA